MPIYTVHAPDGAPADADTAGRIVLVREGFDRAAFLFGPFWLIANRLWRALAGWAVVVVAALAVVLLAGLPPPAMAGLAFLIAFYLGVEAAALKSAALARRGYAVIDVSAAPDEETGERAFFARWLTPATSPAPMSPAPMSTAAASPAPAAPRARPDDVLGLFPRPGGRP